MGVSKINCPACGVGLELDVQTYEQRVQRFRMHAYEIAHAFKVTLDESADCSKACRAEHDTNAARVMPIKSEVTYAIALHELAHLVHPPAHALLSGVSSDRGMLQLEFEAWEWAKKFALEWTTDMQVVADLATSTHILSQEVREATSACVTAFSAPTPEEIIKAIFNQMAPPAAVKRTVARSTETIKDFAERLKRRS